jgi:tetratricopeptide (TPR) repeat protein
VRTAQGRTEEAEEQYLVALEEHPEYVAPVLPLATLVLRRGAPLPEACLELAAERPSAALLLATALYETGDAEEAEGWFRRVLERQPANDAARIGIVETLLARRRYAEAAAEAAAVPPDSPLAAAAASAELFAHAAARDGSALARVSQTAPERGVPTFDVDLYRAWGASIAGRQLPAAVPGAAAQTAFTALEALLRVVDVEAFATLHPVVDRLQIDPRERREALAQMYLRRGFLDSAAEEWIAVAQAAPDARALVGLAQVALAQGLEEDARTFAREALAVEPGNRAAARFCAALA